MEHRVAWKKKLGGKGEDWLTEEVPPVGVGPVLDEQVVDVLVAETRSEGQRVLAIVGIPWKGSGEGTGHLP